MKAICKREGHICSRDGMRQLQLLVIPVVLSPIAAAVMEPMKYEELNSDVKVSRSFGWPSSPSKDEPEMMQNTIPKPRTIRAKRYIPTMQVSKRTSLSSKRRTILGKSLDDGSNYHNYRTTKYRPTPSESLVDVGCERNSNNGAKLVRSTQKP